MQTDNREEFLLQVQNCFRKILESQENIRFLNSYQSLPVNNDGRVVKVGYRTASFWVPKVQLLSIMLNRYTVMVSPHLPGKVRARVLDVHADSQTIDLGDFELADDSIGNRSFVRVSPRSPIRGYFLMDKIIRKLDMIDINIIDLSLYGLAFVVDTQRSLVEGFLEIGEKRKFTYPLMLQNSEHKIVYEGVLTNMVSMGGMPRLRVGVNVVPDTDTERVLAHYLAVRQKELLKELKDLCDAL